jgi:hypothetical protein
MRKTILLSLVLVACATNEAPQEDTAAAMTDDTAMLTAADVSGTWTGTSMAMDGDSVTGRWTIHTANDSMAHLMMEGSTDTIPYRVTYDADSLIAVSDAYTAPDMPGTPVTFRSVGRLQPDGKLAGTVTIRLASNPDSVVARERWESTRTP